VLVVTGAGVRARAPSEYDDTGSPAERVPIADSWEFRVLDQPEACATALENFLAATPAQAISPSLC